MVDHEDVALIALLMEASEGGGNGGTKAWSRILSEVARRRSAVAVWEDRHPPTLDGLCGDALRRARDRLAQWRLAGYEVLTVLDSRYPLRLKAIEPMPALLFVTGRLAVGDLGVAVAGSREATSSGIEVAARIVEGLVGRGLSVISGLAAGIDTAAHETTLAAGGRPIAVLGTGISRVYPEFNRDLHGRVAAAGALVSQFWPDCPPSSHTLRVRNATMAGLGLASVIVEAGERGGTRVHARYALQHGRPLVLMSAVAESTRWGNQLRSHPGVYVADDVSQALRIVDEAVRDDGGALRPADAAISQ
jgi:DNA processing protein